MPIYLLAVANRKLHAPRDGILEITIRFVTMWHYEITIFTSGLKSIPPKQGHWNYKNFIVPRRIPKKCKNFHSILGTHATISH